MYKSIFLTTLICLSSVVAADLSEKWSKRLESADTIYQTAIKKAEDTKSIAVRKATLERTRVLKSAISDATKSGDFTAATELQARLEAAETAGAVRPKPKNTVKFGGHEYALIEEKATWHIAKKRCEEMGGHLATFENPKEQAFLLAFCRDQKVNAWIGLSNETGLNHWQWINSQPCQIDPTWRLDDPDRESFSLGFVYWHPYSTFTDYSLGAHVGYICEWDN